MMIIEEVVEFKIEMKNMMVKDLQGKIKIIEDLQNKTIHGILKANINHKIIIQVVVEAGEEKWMMIEEEEIKFKVEVKLI